MTKVTYYQSINSIALKVIQVGIIGGEKLYAFWDGEYGENYEVTGSFFTEETGVQAAEDAFDLSVSPERQEEREELGLLEYESNRYGTDWPTLARQMTVGDVAKVEDNFGTKECTARYFMIKNVGTKELSPVIPSITH